MRSFILASAFIATLALAYDSDESSKTEWGIAGQNLRNSRSQPGERRIGVANVASLKTKWVFTTGGDVSATPTVADDAVYFPDWAGNLYAVRKLDHESGESRRRAHYGSPVFAGDVVYVGVSSNEEGLAVDPAYPCCSFRGSMVALNSRTGQLLWKTFTAPDNHGHPDGYSGNAIWQPPAMDTARGLLFAGTGNNYEVPQSVKDCLAKHGPAVPRPPASPRTTTSMPQWHSI